MEEGTAIGAYRVLATIGQGGMGTVYLGEHALLGRRAAIKVLLPSLSSDQSIVNRFFNEARAVTMIADPGIVQIFDFGYHTDGSAFLVMELLEGEPMDQRLARIGRFPLADCLRFMRLICNSLGAAHAKGIVHRDLKPENIFLVRDPAVLGGERSKILDFGIAKLSANEPGALKTRTGMLMGTPVYMSPEQCRGAGDIDHRSDIYAIGCVMFTMLAGRPPFEGDASGELIASHLREVPPLASTFVPGLPAVIDHILQRCLAKATAQRFQSMAELVEAFALAELAPAHPTGEALTIDGPQRFAPSAPSESGQRASAAAWSPAASTMPTTLSGASGHTAATLPPRSSRARRARAVVAIAVLGLVGSATVIARQQAGPISDVPRPTSSADGAAAVRTMTTDVDARAAAPGAPSATASDVTAASDAGVVNPASGVGAAVDAGIAEVTDRPDDAATTAPRPTNNVKPIVRDASKGASHANSKTVKAQPIDRGD